jgi:hypothetical protein
VNPRQFAEELAMVERNLSTLRGDVARQLVARDVDWTVESSRAVIERIGLAENLLNDIKKQVWDAKAAALRARSSR